MAQTAAWGVGKSLNSRDAARDAVQQALQQCSGGRPALIVAFVAVGLDTEDALKGISDVLPNVPVWGMRTLGPLSAAGEEGRAVVVGMVGGTRLDAKVQWWPEAALAHAAQTSKVFKEFCEENANAQGMLLALDGLGLNSTAVLDACVDFSAPMAAALGSGDFRDGKTVQFGGERSGTGAAAAMVLGGRLRMGVGMAHGWQPVGITFTARSRSGALGVQQLNDMPAAEALGQVFQHPAREWAYPPLRELVRLYPFNLTVSAGESDVLRSAVRVEVDGSLRMNAPVAEDQPLRLMVGNLESCVAAARQAAVTAKAGLGKARPLLAVVLVDLAWRYLFESRTERFLDAVGEIVEGIPLVGAYTLGQAVSYAAHAPVLQNQHIQVILLGEAEA